MTMTHPETHQGKLCLATAGAMSVVGAKSIAGLVLDDRMKCSMGDRNHTWG